jgi:alkanesulfonate monooxygenase SsuD/methylene tetrahydromethanopterin reductase-like flavin-dependent oxidoreductase (luciferase family)
VFVAETDAEARKRALGGMMARAYREYLLPLFGAFGFTQLFKHDPDLADSEVTPEYLADHSWLVGSPATVAQKLGDMYDACGGFGALLILTFDHSENNEAWTASQQLFMEEVMPKVASLKAT